MQWSFILLPLCLYLGVAGQTFGLYLFGIAIPWIMNRNFQNNIDRRDLVKIGLLLLGCWLLFPITNLINSVFNFWDLTAVSQDSALTVKQLMSSKLSSSWIASAVCLLLIAKFSTVTSVTRSPCPPRIIQSLIFGFALASSLFGIYFLIQHFTGFDYRMEGFTLGNNRLMDGNRYRVSGFFGHPLSAAAISLAIFTFFWTLTFCWGRQNWTTALPRFVLKPLPNLHGSGYRIITCYIALLNLAILFLTGGRVAILIGLALICLTPLFLQHRRITIAIRFGVLFTITICGLLAVIYSGAHLRFLELINQIQNGHLANIERLVFWKIYVTMIADNPVYGHGAAHLSEWVRDAYYSKLGYGDFHQKYNAHNIYLEIVASIGTVGFLILSVCIAFVHKTFAQWSKKTVLLQQVYLAIMISVAVNLANSLTQNVFFDANVLVVYFGFLWAFYWSANHE